MRSDNLNIGISSVVTRRVSSMNATTSPKATPRNFLSWSEKFPSSCLLAADRYNLLRQFLWYLTSWAMMSPFCNFAWRQLSSSRCAHLRTLWSSQNDWMRCNGFFPPSAESPQKKQVELSAIDEWEEQRNPANK